jgi:hypothetical protein
MTLASTALARALLEIRLQVVFGAPAPAIARPNGRQSVPAALLNPEENYV